MKKLIVLVPLILFSCSKKETVSKNNANSDAAILANQNTIINEMDSAANGNVTLEKKPVSTEKAEDSRVITGDSIIKSINADMIPLTIEDEFTNDRQKFYIKIKNFPAKKIVGNVTSKNSDMNIRFNQIKFPNGEYDGPFGADLSEEIKKPGEVWLIVGKNLMASGKSTGKFTVMLK